LIFKLEQITPPINKSIAFFILYIFIIKYLLRFIIEESEFKKDFFKTEYIKNKD
jgi:hypothetical protein